MVIGPLTNIGAGDGPGGVGPGGVGGGAGDSVVLKQYGMWVGLGEISIQQHLRARHCCDVMPLKPQSFLSFVATCAHGCVGAIFLSVFRKAGTATEAAAAVLRPASGIAGV
jgi:hypothetical protein